MKIKCCPICQSTKLHFYSDSCMSPKTVCGVVQEGEPSWADMVVAIQCENEHIFYVNEEEV